MHKTFLLIALTLMVSGSVKAQLAPPANNAPFLNLFADGVQIYQSRADANNPGAFVWQFTAPQADLFTDATKNIHFGTHYAGPIWKADADGSAVVGSVLVRVPSLHPNSIPELLLTASAHSGTGVFEPVTFIQRLDTIGGIAPSTLPTGLGEEFRAPYTATYRFFQAVPEPSTVAFCLSLVAAGCLTYRRKRAR